jgi:K+-sensing histidine kinase KdpD
VTDGGGELRSAYGLIGALIAYLIVTAGLVAFRSDLPSVVPFGLMFIICTVTSWGSSVWSGAYAGILGALFYNFFFTEPYQRLHIDDPTERWLALVLLVSGALSALLGQVFESLKQRGSRDVP